jgi:type VI secretion system protein ImpA
MNQTAQHETDELEPLLAPISARLPEGEDLTFSVIFQQINEARRADNPTLKQGGWTKPLKLSDWGEVRQMCEETLCNNSKDLQLAAWYTEAMAHLEGFAGTAKGLLLTGELLRRFQDALHPNDPEERIGKLEWLNTQLGTTLKQVPLTAPLHGGYHLYQWEESREVSLLQRSSGNAYNKAIEEGKLSVESFEKSARESGADWYRKLLDGIDEAHMAQKGLSHILEEHFGEDAPSFTDINEALDACREVVIRMFELCGGSLQETPPATQPPVDAPAEERASALHRPPRSANNTISSRGDAIRLLREIAKYFRENEPHNPVALLADRAISWAEMPIEKWLKEVIKEEPTLKRINDMLDLDRS